MSAIDPESITFIGRGDDDETNGSATGSFNASLSEDPEEQSFSSSLMRIEETRYNGTPLTNRQKDVSTEHDEPENPIDRAKIKEEYIKFGESIALQLAEIPDSYSRSVAKLKINQILFEAEIGVYAQTNR